MRMILTCPSLPRWSSTLPSLSTQAAMTWVWGKKAGPWLQLNNAGFGIGALTAPLLLSWDIDKHDTFHNACVHSRPCNVMFISIIYCIIYHYYGESEPRLAFYCRYLTIAAANFTVAFTPLLASSPRHDPGAGPEARALARRKRLQHLDAHASTSDEVERKNHESEMSGIDDDTQVCSNDLT